MGLYHDTHLAYGFEVPATTDIDALDDALADQPSHPDSVGHLVVGDYEKTLLITRFTEVEANSVLRLTPDLLGHTAEMERWDAALHAAAVRIGHPEHPGPAWLIVHNYR